MSTTVISPTEKPSSDLMAVVQKRNPGQLEFQQAVEEVYESIKIVLDKRPVYRRFKVMERIVEPERVISFRVPWVDESGEVHVNRGIRVQMNSALGPFKGGLRFHPSVDYSILKFLAFEQVFKNSLTGLPLGGGKGGSDFDPKGKTDTEVMRFCQSFMIELNRHIGHRVDIPAGDIGVGPREIGYLFGTFRKLRNEFTGVITGKGVDWGGSLVRAEATGYGLIYFANGMLVEQGQTLEGKKCIVSGSGNVSQFAMEKILQEGGIPVSASDSSGYVYDDEGITLEKLEFIKKLKNVNRGRIKEYAEAFPNVVYVPSEEYGDYNPIWDLKADCAFPCATQNELNENDANNIVKNGIQLVGEGANMPCTSEAIKVLIDNGVSYAPGKASNAGGVATSGLEMIQNFSGNKWTSREVDTQLRKIMHDIHKLCLDASDHYGDKGNYQLGANVAGFTRVADAMLAQGVI
jgi:glutamate dehydrogenase (NADP+)